MSAPPSDNKQRAYSAAHFMLVLDSVDGRSDGFFRSVEGGGIKTSIMDHRRGNQIRVWRQVAKPEYEDIKVQVGMSMSLAFYDWIANFFRGEIVRKNGSILAGDFKYLERARRDFKQVLISEVTIPKLDASDHNPCYMGVTLVPEAVEFQNGSGQPIRGNSDTAQKLWTPSNFRFALDAEHLGVACRRVTKVESFTIKQTIMTHHAGSMRNAVRVPGIIEFPNITIYLPESDAMPFIQEFQRVVVRGEPPERHTGEIAFNDHTGAELCRINLEGLQIANVAPDRSDASSDDIKQVKIELAVEGMRFEYSQPGSAGTEQV